MPIDALPDRPEQLLADLLVSEWAPSNVHGYAPDDGPGQDTHLPTAMSLDNVGRRFPSLVVTPSNQTTAGDTTYDFLTDGQPGQVRRGSVLATARAQDRPDASYQGEVDAATLVHDIRVEVERIARANADGGTTAFSFIGSQPAADAPDDLTDEPPVRLAQVELRFGWLRA